MSYKLIALILGLVVVLGQYPSAVFAQDAHHKSKSQKDFTLPAFTPIKLTMLEGINSQSNREGDEVVFSVAEDVVIMGQTYLVKGTPVIGRVTHVQSAKGWGKSGNFDVQITSLFPLYSSPIKVTGETASSSKSQTIEAVAPSVVMGVSVVGLLAGGSIKGKRAEIDAGQTISVYTAEKGNVMDIPVNEMRKKVDNWYHETITTNFLNYSWDNNRTISERMSAMGYTIDKAKIKIKPMDDYYYQIDVPVKSGMNASFRFQPFEEGRTQKFRKVDGLNDIAKRILGDVK